MRSGRWQRALQVGCGCALLGLAPGCGMVPQRRLEDSRTRIQALQAENEQLRDVVLNVRSKNRDLAARASDDARRVRTLEDANEQLERSVLAYQDEAKQVSALLDQLRSQMRLAATAGNTNVSLRERLHNAFAQESSVRVDPDALTVSLPRSALFDDASGALTADAKRWLGALGAAIRADAQAGNADTHREIEITGATSASAERLANGDVSEVDAAMQWRLQRLRAEVEHASGLGADVFRVVPTADGVVEASNQGWVTIRVAESTVARSEGVGTR